MPCIHIHICIYPSIYLSVCLPVCLSVYLSALSHVSDVLCLCMSYVLYLIPHVLHLVSYVIYIYTYTYIYGYINYLLCLISYSSSIHPSICFVHVCTMHMYTHKHIYIHMCTHICARATATLSKHELFRKLSSSRCSHPHHPDPALLSWPTRSRKLLGGSGKRARTHTVLIGCRALVYELTELGSQAATLTAVALVTSFAPLP